MPLGLGQKELLKFYSTHKSQDLKEAVLYGGGCIVQAWSA